MTNIYSDGSIPNANAGSNPYTYVGQEADGTSLVANDATVSTANPLPVAVVTGGGGGSGTSLAQAITYYDVITAGTGYSVGDVLARLIEITPGATDTLVARWVNITQNTELSGSPTMANLVEQSNAGAATTASSMPTGGVGIIGWLSALYTKIAASIAITAAALPLPTGASTSAKQPALGTAGTASTDVLSVQGIASMTALKTDGSAVTQPVSATALPLPAGAATAAKQAALGTAGTASSDVLSVQGITGMTPVATSGGALARTNRSGSIATGGTAQNVFTAGQATHGFYFQNLSTSVMYIRDDSSAASAGSGSILVAASGGYYESPVSMGAPTAALSVFCATTSAAYTCMTA